MINFKDVSYEIEQNEIFANFNLTIKPKQKVAIVGPSGCGKSTLLRLMLKLIKPTTGKVEINSKSYGYMPQNDLLFDWLTVGENINLPNALKAKELDDESLQALLDKFHVNAKIDEYPNSLSGGMKSRVNLMRALNMSDELLLLDEPFSKLDYLTHLKITSWFKEFINTQALTTVLVTHNIDEAILLADRIIVLSAKPAQVVDDIMVNDLDKELIKAKIIKELD